MSLLQEDYEFWLHTFDLYAMIVTQTVSVEGELGFDVPPPGADADTLKAGADALLDADADLMMRWEAAIREADAPPNDPDLLPAEQLDDSQKKAKR